MASRIEITRVECCLPLSKRQWTRLEKLDKKTLDDDKLFSGAINAGVLRGTFEYNGHFGCNLFFRTDAPPNLEAIEAEIIKVIGKP